MASGRQLQKGLYMNPTNNQTRAVLWDMDGTLIDSMPYHVEAWTEVLEPLGYHFAPEQLLKTFGLRNEEIVRDHLKLDRPQAELQRLIEEKEERYRRLVSERGLTLLPGARHWLDDLKAADWPQALVSSAPRLNMAAVLQGTQLGDFMDTIVCAEDVERGKPYPDPFLLAAERLSIRPCPSPMVLPPTSQQPPRRTRYSPLAGPVGSVCFSLG